MACPSSPTGLHCMHGHQGAWFGIAPPPSWCCHCGADPNFHGPHVHGPSRPHATTASEIKTSAFVRYGVLALALLFLPGNVGAQGPTPTPAVNWSLHSTIGTLTKAGADKTPIIGMRASLDVPTLAGARLILRADLSRMSDGGAVDQGGVVPSFETGEIYLGIYRPIAGPLAIEAVVGRAFALDPEAELLEGSPDIFGGGLRVSVRGGFAFVGVGQHGAAGKGTRLLVSLLLPAKGNTSLYVDGALGERGKSDVRSGMAVRF